MVKACVEGGAHHLDISGEPAVGRKPNPDTFFWDLGQSRVAYIKIFNYSEILQGCKMKYDKDVNIKTGNPVFYRYLKPNLN